MVYQTFNQTARYHQKPDQFLTTHAHFYDHANVESPDPERRKSTHKRSTFGMTYPGSAHNNQLYNIWGGSKKSSVAAKHATLSEKGPNGLFPDPLSRTQPSSTYRGNGTFTVEYPHSSITYKSLKMVPYAKLSWRSEYSDNFTPKQPYPGYSVLSTRR